CQKYNESPWTF
nr:immunoglobulin light chain junction region [Macaca mulatta]